MQKLLGENIGGFKSNTGKKVLYCSFYIGVFEGRRDASRRPLAAELSTSRSEFRVPPGCAKILHCVEIGRKTTLLKVIFELLVDLKVINCHCRDEGK